MDPIRQFIEEECVTGDDQRVKTGLLRDAYVVWCRQYRRKPEKLSDFKAQLTDLGHPPTPKGEQYIGIALQIDDAPFSGPLTERMYPTVDTTERAG